VQESLIPSLSTAQRKTGEQKQSKKSQIAAVLDKIGVRPARTLPGD
jgi:hypothetical protein